MRRGSQFPPFDLLIEPFDGFIDFLLGEVEKSDVH